MLKYGLIIYWSEDDQAFVVEVPELPGCAADGETIKKRSPMSRSSSKSGLRLLNPWVTLFPPQKAAYYLLRP